MNELLKMSIKGAKSAQAKIQRYKVSSEKAMNTAMKVEAFKLRNLLRRDLLRGNPGGADLAPLSHIARNIWRNKNRKPLAKLRPGVRYRVSKQKPYTIEVGFVQPGAGSHKISNSWRRLADWHQKGFTRTITPRQRWWIVYRGAQLGKVDGGDTPFFLRKTPRTLTTPARPIIDPFWRANQAKAQANIKKNFKAKLSGKRI